MSQWPGENFLGLFAQEDEHLEINVGNVVLATGGIGRLWSRTTNPAEATGDGLAMAFRAGAALADMEFRLLDPPAGITLTGVRKTRNGVTLTLAAERGKAVPGRLENLLVEAEMKLSLPRRSSKEKKAPATRQESLLLPALACVVVEK